MKKIIAAVLFAGLALAAPRPSEAACTNKTTGLTLQIPNFNDAGDVWGTCMINSFNIINASAAVLGSGATNYMDKLLVNSIGALDLLGRLCLKPDALHQRGRGDGLQDRSIKLHRNECGSRELRRRYDRSDFHWGSYRKCRHIDGSSRRSDRMLVG